jgi:hypothetical protein
VARIVSFRRWPVRRSPSSVGGLGTAARPWPDQADSLLRPFARRRASTRRPPREAMRARKPCSRFRARFLGWYVCFAISPCSIPLRFAVLCPGPSHTNGWRMPASRDGLVARFRCGGFYRRLAKAVKPRRMLAGLAPHCLVRKVAATLPRPPGPDAASKAPRAPGRSTISDPSTRGAGDWRLFIDGCEAGLARRPR